MRSTPENLRRAGANLGAAAAAAVVATVLITRADVAFTDLLGYVGYLVVFLTLPGVIVWRLLWTGGRGTLLEHAVFGTLVGIVLQLPVYVVGLAVGFPRLTVLLPLGALAVVVVRRDRRALLLPEVEPLSPLVSWTLAAATSYALLWETRIGWSLAPAWGKSPADPIGDQAFHLSLVGELRHHASPTMPFVDGVPLRYHWFVNEFVASTSWWTHAPTWALLDRMLLPTMIALVLGAVAVLGQKLGGKPWVGALAVLVMGFVGDLSPFRWSQVRSSFDERFLAYYDPVSPSLQFSVAILLLLTMVLLHVLRTPRIGRRDIALLILSAVFLPLAKGSAMPLVFGGLVCVLGVGLLRRSVRRRDVGLLAAMCAVLVGAQLTIFRGASGLVVDPLHLSGFVSWNLGLSGQFGGPPFPATTVVTAFATVGLVVSWFAGAVGSFGFARAGVWRDQRAVFLVGAGLAGCTAALTFGSAYLNEDYFVRTTPALFALASAWGLSVLVADRSPRQRAGILGGSLVVGFLVALGASYAAPAARPVVDAHNQNHLVAVMLRPYAVIVVLVGVVGVSCFVAARRGVAGRAPALAVLLAVVVGLGLLRVPHTFQAVSDAPTGANRGPAHASIGRGGTEAATWLRDHGTPEDLLATNAHYLLPGGTDNRHFWLSAIAERRVLVEGWGYTPKVAEGLDDDTSQFDRPFWDQGLLRANDAAFTTPSAATLAFLREHHVRWLFVDDRFPVDLAGLRKVAHQRFHAGRYWVFALPGR
ncbi:MAG: hypothetical protein ACJ72D_20170 [Marmoricola sp.]